MTENPERPGPDATSPEIMEWMEQDFAYAVAEGVANAAEEDHEEDTTDEATDPSG